MTNRTLCVFWFTPGSACIKQNLSECSVPKLNLVFVAKCSWQFLIRFLISAFAPDTVEQQIFACRNFLWILRKSGDLRTFPSHEYYKGLFSSGPRLWWISTNREYFLSRNFPVLQYLVLSFRFLCFSIAQLLGKPLGTVMDKYKYMMDGQNIFPSEKLNMCHCRCLLVLAFRQWFRVVFLVRDERGDSDCSEIHDSIIHAVNMVWHIQVKELCSLFNSCPVWHSTYIWLWTWCLPGNKLPKGGCYWPTVRAIPF